MLPAHAKAFIVCWRCKRDNTTLRNVRSEEVRKKTGKRLKTRDYICDDCSAQGFYTPPIANSSLIYIPTKEELEAQLKILQAEAPAPPPTPTSGVTHAT